MKSNKFLNNFGEVALWRFNLNQKIQNLENEIIAQTLSNDERRIIATMPEGPRKLEITAGRFYLRQLLAAILDIPDGSKIEIDKDARGKLYLKSNTDVNLHFNISHSQRYLTIVIANGTEVGVDIEELDRNIDPIAIAKSYFSPAEQKYLVGLTSENFRSAFFEIWVIKEAYIKAVGKGFHMPLNAFSVLKQQNENGVKGAEFKIKIFGQIQENHCKIQLINETSYVLALAALSKENGPLIYHDFGFLSEISNFKFNC